MFLCPLYPLLITIYWRPPKDKNIKQALFCLASVARILCPLAFALLSLFFRDWGGFALDNIGKVAEKFVLTLSRSLITLSMFFSIPVVIKWRLSSLNLWWHLIPVSSLPVVFIYRLLSCSIILGFNSSIRSLKLIASLLHLDILLMSRGCSLQSSNKSLPSQAGHGLSDGK